MSKRQMLTVTIQMDRTTALVIQDIAAMENRVQVIKPEKKMHLVAVGQPRLSQHAVPRAVVTTFAPFQSCDQAIKSSNYAHEFSAGLNVCYCSRLWHFIWSPPWSLRLTRFVILCIFVSLVFIISYFSFFGHVCICVTFLHIFALPIISTFIARRQQT